ncbi:MAG: hypothetical protein L0Y42_05510, partial [Phycisphaerales bacterium]|nr:hypothetical protein [Phycisphaerales bacterium]
MRCKGCHYSLKKLVERRCPECGRGFDPDDARTFEGEGRRGRDLVPRMSYVLLAFGVVYVASLLLVLGAAP